MYSFGKNAQVMKINSINYSYISFLILFFFGEMGLAFLPLTPQIHEFNATKIVKVIKIVKYF